MLPIILAATTFVSTFAGGMFALRNRDRLHRILGFTAGILIGVVAFDLLPEIYSLVRDNHASDRYAMVALVCGFLAFHIIEKSILIHHSQEDEYGSHHHPQVGVISALALAAHSFFDGLAIGLGFQASNTIGVAVAIAVIAHDFSDGINTVSMMLINKNNRRRTLQLLLVDALAPVLGAVSTLFFTVSEGALVIYLGFFAGFLLYIGASEILPEAHSKHSSYRTIVLTVLGAAVMFAISLAHS
jgi:zinc and cadmium transporter